MTQIIPPTPGSVVWYWPSAADGIASMSGAPLAAIVAGVHSDRLVNLAVFDFYGNAQQRSNVRLVQPDDAIPDFAYASWMPYQINAAGIAAPEASAATGDMFAESDGTSASETGLVKTAAVRTKGAQGAAGAPGVDVPPGGNGGTSGADGETEQDRPVGK